MLEGVEYLEFFFCGEHLEFSEFPQIMISHNSSNQTDPFEIVGNLKLICVYDIYLSSYCFYFLKLLKAGNVHDEVGLFLGRFSPTNSACRCWKFRPYIWMVWIRNHERFMCGTLASEKKCVIL